MESGKVQEECDDGNTNDNDGCSSTCSIEFAQACTGEPSVCVCNNEDSDGDTIIDCTEGIVDTDGDGAPDYLDPDDDGDGITTATEITRTIQTANGDTNNDGTPDYRQKYVASVARGKHNDYKDLISMKVKKRNTTTEIENTCEIVEFGSEEEATIAEDTAYDFPHDINTFEVKGCTEMDVKLYIYETDDVSNYVYRKYGQKPDGSGT